MTVVEPVTLEERLNELESTYLKMRDSLEDGIPGIVKIESKVPGPTLGITVCTHGNEPSGLAALKHLFDIKVEKKLVCGTLYLVVNNLAATGEFFADRKRTPNARKKRRYLDCDMNRLPLNLMEPTYATDPRSEIQRARSLYSVWSRLTVGFDIHSTGGADVPMIITGRGVFHENLVRGFEMNKVLDRIDLVQIGTPVFGFMGGAGSAIPVFEIEAGTHDSVLAFNRAAECAELLLKNLGMLEGEVEAKQEPYEIYEIFDTLVFPNSNHTLPRYFENFEVLPKGTVLAQSPGTEIVAATECHSFFCSKEDVAPPVVTGEVLFLSRPMRKSEQ